MHYFEPEFVDNRGGLEVAAIHAAEMMGEYKFTGTEG